VASAYAYPGATQCLLDLDPELADGIESQALPAARAAAIALTFGTDAGALPLAPWLSRAAPGPGILVLEGVVAVDVTVADRVSAELLGAGDLLQPASLHPDEFLSSGLTWRAIASSRFALLDGNFAKRVRFYPQLDRKLLGRAARRVTSLGVQMAIAAQPRLEVRLALMLWHLAARWGKVDPAGISLPLPLTHHLLARLVGAERPSVSHALARLAHAGLVTGHGDEWHLDGQLRERIGLMTEPGGGHHSRLGTGTGGFGRVRGL
jgi:CRP/FNR family transcriptional regulator, cyclic AMP receptor protein